MKRRRYNNKWSQILTEAQIMNVICAIEIGMYSKRLPNWDDRTISKLARLYCLEGLKLRECADELTTTTSKVYQTFILSIWPVLKPMICLYQIDMLPYRFRVDIFKNPVHTKLL